ncbi:MAG: cytochrome c [Maribacter sp.]|nr:cytochrome c [Maribacter sp.]
MKKIGTIGLVLVLIVLYSCEYNVENETPLVDNLCENVVSYSVTIRPLIDGKCMPCHNGDGSEPFAPDLTTYPLVESIAGLIKDVTQSRRMPKVGSLSDSEIAAIKCWVDNGALNN